MRKWLLFFVLFLLALSCNSRRNKDLIPKDDLVPLLVDLQIADAIALNNPLNQNLGRLDSALLYGTILEDYGYTKQQLAYTMEYYSGRNEEMTAIFDDVFSELSKQSEEVKEKYYMTSGAETDRIWQAENQMIKIIGDTASYPDPFDIPIKTTGTYVLSLDIDRNKHDQAENPRVVGYFYNPENDTPDNRIYFDEIPIPITNSEREFTLIKEMNDSTLTRFKLFTPQYENTDSLFYKNITIKRLRLTRIKTDSKPSSS